jgi:hypothetical protein
VKRGCTVTLKELKENSLYECYDHLRVSEEAFPFRRSDCCRGSVCT